MYDTTKRQELSQNFIKNPSLVRYFVDLMDCPSDGLVIDLGAGQGIITRELLNKGYSVWAVEKDRELVAALKENLGHNIHLKIIGQDIRAVQYPFDPYWVIANPPFQIFSQLIKDLLFGKNSPEGILLVGQKEAVERLTGVSEVSLISTLFQSLYTIDIPHDFRPTDFSPAPGVETCVLRATKIPTHLWQDSEEYQDFLKYAFLQQKSTLQKNLKDVFTYDQWKHISKQYQFPFESQVGDLSISQWKGLFRSYQQRVDESKKRKLKKDVL